VKHEDGQVPEPSALDDLLGVSSTSMDVDPSSVSGQTELNAYMRVQQVPYDTDPLMWWKQHQREFPRLTCITRQYLDVPVNSAFPERFFSSVGLVKSDLRGSLLGTSLIDVRWAKLAGKHPIVNLKESKRKSKITQTYTHYTGTRQYICNWHAPIFVTGTH
jgi:hypothetical protein